MARIPVGLDVGFGAFKASAPNKSALVVSHVAEAPAQDYELTPDAASAKGKPDVQVIRNGVGRYLVGADVTQLVSVRARMDYDKLATAPEMRALFYATLSRLDISSKDEIALYVGVPLGFLQGDDVKARIATLKGWMTGAHKWEDGKRDRAANIAAVTLLSQPQAAYLDFVKYDDGRDKAAALLGEVGVISIGHNTLELLAFKDGASIKRFAHGSRSGVRRLLEMTNNKLGGDYSIAELDAQLRAGDLDTTASIGDWLSNIEMEVDTGWQANYKRFTAVVAVGGGLPLARPALKKLFDGRLAKVDDPVMSISRGLLKYGLTQ